ncbi:GntR family transcriptional regulator [Acidipropionibacterium jensenii]|uniref:GntR family transcriptional regulator n=1 Tax=Acidipropionibacterium jensenii TaxID=1749 RepID=A0A3T0S1C0_9ACTN|nr:GntR family transcriptional regulator [Acidipropionibacterium jensenii]AZZ40170.1 GntR family transcriptional regulator [Acidipropionibacterium jensenii]
MIWTVDPTAPEPLYAQLAAQVHLALARGELAPGERLPSARQLAQSLDLNIHTVLHAFQLLRDEGVVELRRGRGAVITAHQGSAPTSAVHQALRHYLESGRAAGLPPEALITLVKEALRS